MSIFTFCVTLGPGLAPVIFSWVEANPRFEWRWIQWFQMSTSYSRCFLPMGRIVGRAKLTISHIRSLSPYRHLRLT